MHFTVSPLKISWMTGGVQLCFCCTYVFAGNDIVERSHGNLKKIAARKQCSIMEAVYWHITLKDDILSTNAPANIIHHYQLKVKGITTTLLLDRCKNHSLYKIGNSVGEGSPWLVYLQVSSGSRFGYCKSTNNNS